MTRTMGKAMGIAKYGGDWDGIYFFRKEAAKI